MTSTRMEDLIAILKLIDSSSCEEVRLEVEDLKLHVQKPPPTLDSSVPAVMTSPAVLPPSSPAAHVVAAGVSFAGTSVTAPMVGVFYRAPEPGAAPFVKLGDKVSSDTVVCIIESMKMMNTLKAGTAGRIVKIAVSDGDFVKYGQHLFIVEAETN